ncbi:ABC transporter ATP-binding protein [Salarchaeum sp. III]|uniref:ABC transporter ATP-binding protein n=1 Tax=Salarchaeum sp. III TaxID=3107927 RepID=UPI002ED8571E
MTVPSGVVYGFLGPNGSGKTTTLRLITGLIEPTHGDVYIRGNPVSNTDYAVSSLGYAPATPAVSPQLSAREHLRYVADFRGLRPEDADERISELLNQFDLADAADDWVETYSTGMKQKLNLLQACLHEPSVLILDEPTAGLDPQSVRVFKDFVEEYSDRGNTVLLSTHILSIVEKVADVIGIISDGTLVFEGTPSQVRDETETDFESAFLELTNP